MVENVKEVINATFEEVNSSSLVLKLLDAYSKLFANGAQLGGCSLCLRDYYNQLKQKGLEMAEKYEQVQVRTCKPAWNGLWLINAAARHYNSEWITDEEAIDLLNRGIVKESDFEVLPENYKPAVEEPAVEKKQRKVKSKEDEQTA